VSVNSDDAAVIRRVISGKKNLSTHLLCIVGIHTHQSRWVEWEIRKAVELGKKIVAVKTASTNGTPAALFGNTDQWAMSFTFESIQLNKQCLMAVREAMCVSDEEFPPQDGENQ
jgi:hypothetical protein